MVLEVAPRSIVVKGYCHFLVGAEGSLGSQSTINTGVLVAELGIKLNLLAALVHHFCVVAEITPISTVIECGGHLLVSSEGCGDVNLSLKLPGVLELQLSDDLLPGLVLQLSLAVEAPQVATVRILSLNLRNLPVG